MPTECCVGALNIDKAFIRVISLQLIDAPCIFSAKLPAGFQLCPSVSSQIVGRKFANDIRQESASFSYSSLHAVLIKEVTHVEVTHVNRREPIPPN